ncbi:uncharacterized protein LOC118439064 [Folsomia candida]|uniref:uncharacterized protein LOC118439064 n=2 Tax=Folsomia candida TaxID=158441 RepID=UPI001604A76D|nr:uncharacterized protein LOC118439064 [Folsomia candida]
MGDFVEKVLEIAGLVELIATFKDQDVDENVLRKLPDCQVGSLEERLLADIVPSIGRRLKIINAIREVAAVSTLQNKRLFNYLEHPLIVANTSSEYDKSSEQQLENMYKLVLINNEETCSQSNNNFEQESICSVNISEVDKCLSLSDQLFNVKEIIVQSDREKGTAKGQEMLQLIISQGMASFQVKSLIKRRTVNYLIRNYSNYPPRHVKKNLAECISSQLFGHLAEQQQIDIKSLFYSDAKSIDTEEMDQKGRIIYKNIPATGLIEDRLKYLRNKNCISIRKKPRVLDSITNDPTVEEYEMKSWLSNSKSPASQVLQYMKDTFNLRSLELKNTTNLSNTLQEWPHLLETSGVIDQDFERLNPGKSEIMLRKWPSIAKQICEFAERSQTKAIAESGIKKMFSTLSLDEITIAAFVMLPYLTSTSAYKKRGAKKVKISAAAAADFFIQFVSKTFDLESFKANESERRQPFVVCVGDLANLIIKDVYVMLERKLIKSPTIISAVDLCFKLFHVLKLKFPDECYPVWSFFDHTVYQINEIVSPPASVLALGSHIIV